MLKNIEQLAKKFNDIEELKTELKRVQSVKCRLKKMKAKDTYEQDMLEVVAYEQALKEAREYFEPKKANTTTLTQAEIELLTYDETIRAIKNIQSKKCNSQYLTKDVKDNEEYQNAVKIEQLLLAHKKTVQPLPVSAVKKTDVKTLIDQLENSQDDLSKAYILEQLKNLL